MTGGSRVDKLAEKARQQIKGAVRAAESAPAAPVPTTALSPPAVQRERVMGQLVRERDDAKELAAQFEGAAPQREIDPKRTRRSTFANRDDHAMQIDDIEFKGLVDSIAACGHNTVPVRVRPVEDRDADFELAFGHRRHAAVLYILAAIDRGEMSCERPKLIAVVMPMDDAALVDAMWDENANRKDLSPWETAHTLSLLQSVRKLTVRELEQRVPYKKSMISLFQQLLALPVEVLDAFGEDRRCVPAKTPEILSEALKTDRSGVLERARVLVVENRGSSSQLPAKKVLAVLLGQGLPGQGGAGGSEVEITRTASGVTITAPDLSDDELVMLQKTMAKLMAKRARK